MADASHSRDGGTRSRHRKRRRGGTTTQPPRSNRGLKIMVGISVGVLIFGGIIWFLGKVLKKKADDAVKGKERLESDLQAEQRKAAALEVKYSNVRKAVAIGLSPQGQFTEDGKSILSKLVEAPSVDSVAGDVTYVITPIDHPEVEATDSGLLMPGGTMDTPFGQIVAAYTVGSDLDRGESLNMDVNPSFEKLDIISRRAMRLRRKAAGLSALNSRSLLPSLPSYISNQSRFDASEIADNVLVENGIGFGNIAGGVVQVGNDLPTDLEIAQDKNSIKYCTGGLDYLYIPPFAGMASYATGTCIKKCDPKLEELVVWRQPASGQSAYSYGCRSLCLESPADTQGFCQRLLLNPSWSNGNGSKDDNRVWCHGNGKQFQHWGRFCVNLGDAHYVEGQTDLVGIGGNGNLPMFCQPGWSATPSGLSCYQCPPNYPILKGNESNPYVCTHACSKGSSDKNSGSTYQCIQNFTPSDPIPAKEKDASADIK